MHVGSGWGVTYYGIGNYVGIVAIAVFTIIFSVDAVVNGSGIARRASRRSLFELLGTRKERYCCPLVVVLFG